MPEPNREGPDRGETPLFAYAIGSGVVWAVLMPLIDRILGDTRSLGASALQGALMGLIWGLLMHPVQRWHRRRRA